FGEGLVEKSSDALRGPSGEVGAGVMLHQSVVFALAVRVDVIPAIETANVPIEVGADMVEFVERGHEFLKGWMVEKSREVEGQDVENLVLAIEKASNGPLAALALFGQRPVGESHRS